MLFKYKGVFYGIQSGYYRMYSGIINGNWFGPRFYSWENLHKYIDVLIVKGVLNEKTLKYFKK